LGYVVVPADMSFERELFDRAAGPAVDGVGEAFRCRMNQIATAAPSTMHKIIFTGDALVLGDGSGFIEQYPLCCVCGNISQIEGSSNFSGWEPSIPLNTQPSLTYDGDLPFRRPGESMYRVAILIQVPKRH
jgi:hypothetical protein